MKNYVMTFKIDASANIDQAYAEKILQFLLEYMEGVFDEGYVTAELTTEEVEKNNTYTIP